MLLLTYIYLDMQRSIAVSLGMLIGELLAWGPALTNDRMCVRLKCQDEKKEEK